LRVSRAPAVQQERPSAIIDFQDLFPLKGISKIREKSEAPSTETGRATISVTPNMGRPGDTKCGATRRITARTIGRWIR
jgi:hypothetical protein